MKKGGNLSIILLILLLWPIASSAQRREPLPVEFVKISGRLYEITGGSGARGGMYVGDNGVLVIDAKMDKDSVDRVLQEIERIAGKPVVYLVNTHSDGDHIMGNRFFSESVTVISHENCRKEFFLPQRDGSPSEWSNPELSPFIPSLTFRDKMDVYLGSKKVELWHFGTGHTVGDTVVYFPEENVAFVGDQYFKGRPPLIHSYKGGNSFGHVTNLESMLAALDANQFMSGHSDPASREDIRNHIAVMKKRHEKVSTLIQTGKTLDEIKREFGDNESELVETIFTEITTSSSQ